MKSVIVSLLLIASLGAVAQPPPVPCNESGPCVYIVPDSVTPAVQINATLSPGYGLITTTVDGMALHASAVGRGTAITASAVGAGVALRVNGPIVKAPSNTNRIRVYDPDTGALIGEFVFEFVVISE